LCLIYEIASLFHLQIYLLNKLIFLLPDLCSKADRICSWSLALTWYCHAWFASRHPKFAAPFPL